MLHSLGFSFKNAHKLLGKASPQRRAEFVQALCTLLQQAQQEDGPLVCFADEAHIHLDVEPGHGWAPRGKRLYVDQARTHQAVHGVGQSHAQAGSDEGQPATPALGTACLKMRKRPARPGQPSP